MGNCSDNLTRTLGTNLSEIPTGCLGGQFAFFVDMFDMLYNIRSRSIKYFCNLLLCQPDSLPIETDVNRDLFIFGLENNDLLF